MAKGYLIGRVSVRDPEGYKEYAALASAAITQYGGKILARGGQCETVEGSGRPRNVVIEFESYARALEYFHSPEYSAARAVRQPLSRGDFVVVEGI
jgi:uncharacterized protein (DUF1330 family)